MTRTRAVTLTALVAASAMVFAACSSSPGQAPSTTASSSAPASAPSASSAPASGATSSAPASGAVASSGAPSSGAPSTGTAQAAGTEGCGKPSGPYTDPGTPAGAVTVGFNELSTSWNNLTSHGNSVYSANAL